MLVLKRSVRESFVIGEKGEIEVAILSVDGRCVRVGIDAPDDTPIYRKEIFIEDNLVRNSKSL